MYKLWMIMMLLIPSLSLGMEAELFQRQFDLIQAEELESVEAFLTENRERYAQDPEYYVLLLNYAFMKGHRNELIVAAGEPQDGDIAVSDPETGEVVGFIGNRLSEDPDLIVNSITETQQAQQHFPQRLDIHFGIVHIASLIQRWDIMGAQLVNIVRTSNTLQHHWQWGSINTMDGDPREFMLENVQAKISLLFHAEHQEADAAIEDVSEALIEEFPEVIYGYANLGVLYLATQQYASAEHYLNQALGIDPQDEIVNGNLEILRKKKIQHQNTQQESGDTP
jgi:tetratricopeptide (TPR) repeat protein